VSFIRNVGALGAATGDLSQLLPRWTRFGVSGVMRWFHGRPLFQQSLLFKTNDNFWFTFFHEAKHVLQMRKKQIFIEGGQSQPDDSKREEEANRFASEILIPGDAWENFVRKEHFESERIRTFAKSIAIHAGIISGRLLKEGLVGYDKQKARLETKCEWAS